MRIGIDARLWNETGVGRYIRNLVEQLLTLDKKNEYVLFVRPVDDQKIKNQISNIKIKWKMENKKWRIVPCNIHWHSFEEQLHFPKVLYKENLDLMHFPYFSLPLFYDKPFVVTIHDLIINHFPTGKASTLPYPLYKMKRVGYDFVMNHAIENSAKIIVPLNAVKDDVMQTFNVSSDKVVVTYEGVETRLKFKDQSSKIQKDEYFLYVGNAYPHKNLERLISAFLLAKQTLPEAKLFLVGKDDYFYQRLRAKVEKQQISDIRFLHDVDDQELFALYKNARCFVSASLMEGFGLPPLEALSMSCPVLLSNIPSFNEVCKDSALYFNPLVVNDLAKKLHTMYHLEDKQKAQLIKKGLERVKKFSWHTMAKQTLDIYNNVAAIRGL